MTTTALFLILLFLLWICVNTSKKILLTPQFCFTLSFVFSAGYSLISNVYIQLEMSLKTFIVISLGVMVFIVASICINGITSINKPVFQKNETLSNIEYIEQPIKLSNYILIIYILIGVIIIVFYRAFYIKTTGIGSYAEALYYYRNAVMFTENEMKSVPYLILFIRRCCVAFGYIISYLFIHAKINSYKINNMLFILAMIIATYNNTLAGSRGPAFIYIFSTAVQLYILYGNKKKWRRAFRFKHILIAIAASLLALLSFRMFGNILGRNSTKTISNYLAVYVSAPIKNLDTFIRDNSFKTKFNDQQTLIYAINYFGKVFDINSWIHTTTQPFRYNSYGYGLGNVYTTFYAFMYDAGWGGLIFYTLVMAIISQIFFKKAVNCNHYDNKPKIKLPILIYSYMVPALVQCFFSNKYYESIFNPLFWMYIVVWCISTYAIRNIKISIRNTRITTLKNGVNS